MQICGQEVNIEDLKTKTAELQALMSDPEVLSSIESKVAEMNEKLNSFKPEIPEVPSLQEALSELNAELSSSQFAAKLKKIKSDFGEVVDDLPEILNKVNSKLNEFLDDLPDSKDLTAVLDGSLIGEALAKASAAIAEAELKLQQKLARQGKPTIDTTKICKDVPNIEVETKTIQVEEIRTRIIRGIPTQETVTVQKEVKQKVELPAEPVIPKTVPVKSEPKPVQKTSTVDPVIEADKHLLRVSAAGLKAVRQIRLKEFQSDEKLYRQKTQAYVFFYYIEVAKQLGVAGTTNKEIQANAIKRRMRAKWGLDVELAESLVPEEDRDYLYRITGTLYEGQPTKSGVFIVDQVSYKQALANYARLQ